MATYPQQTFPNFAALMNYINSLWITNGNQEITGVIGNNVVNGLLTFIEQSPLNWETADIISSSGVVTVTRPVSVFLTNTPSSLSFGSNIYNEYVFINTTTSNIPLVSGLSYVDITLTSIDNIPALSVVNIVLAENSLWILKSFSSLVGTPPKALRGTVGVSVGFPIAGDTSWQNDLLIGIGGDDNEYSFLRDGTPVMSYGNSKSFDFDNVEGLITLIDGQFIDGEGLDAPLLQTIK